MNKLKIYKFSDLYSMSSGISSKPIQAGHGFPFVSFTTVFNNYFLPSTLLDLMNSSESEQATYSVKKGDIFLTRTSETLDELGMSCVSLKDYNQATYSGFVKRLRPIDAKVVNEKYMGFYLRSELFRKAMNNNAVMTLRASLNEEIFSYLKIYLPDYDTQKKIGEFLFLLNSKIELNNQVSQELKLMTKTLYDYWFVQFDFPNKKGNPYKASGGRMLWNEELKREIPEGWETNTVGNKLKTYLGGTPSRTNLEYWDQGDIPWLSSGEIANFPVVNSVEKITEKGLKNSAAKLLNVGSVMISITGNIRASILAIDASANQSVVGIEENDYFKKSYLYFFIINHIPQYQALMTGAVQKHINKDVIDSTLLLTPPKDILDSYYSISEPIIQQIMNLSKESQKLTELRDWLLPMLMNGQVKVN